jgi:long-chain acyl-CoA synthetase
LESILPAPNPTLAPKPTLHTVLDVLTAAAAANNPQAMRFKDSGAWHDLSGSEVLARVQSAAATLRGYGINPGDRIAIIAENRWQWGIADFAILYIGAVCVPIYPTLTAEQTACLLRDSGARIVIVSTRSQLAKVAAGRAQTSIERVIMMDPPTSSDDAIHFDALLNHAPMSGPAAITPDSLATIIYTSGTTGEPKGVMLTHGNLASNLTQTVNMMPWGRHSSCISFLPLSHITARHLDYAVLALGASLAYCPNIADIARTMQEIQPTIFVSVPRLYEKIRQESERKSAASPIKQRIFAWARKTGQRNRATILEGRTPASPLWKIADRLVYSKIRAAFGGRVQQFIAGGAPLGIETAEWFADMSIRILEGYGLTETSPVVALNIEGAYRIGSVGKPVTNIELRLADDGELLLRGPSIFIGYWNNQQATREAFLFDPAFSWFLTGDIARLDSDNFLYITDRKKELIKTAGGKFIAPAMIENKLKTHILVGQCAVIGDKQKFPSVLISPNFAALEEWATAHNVPTASREELVAHPDVIAQYRQIIRAVNESLAPFERLSRSIIVADEWSIATGELTPTLKLKRRILHQQYAQRIRALESRTNE